jgi:hypothetical protein
MGGLNGYGQAESSAFVDKSRADCVSLEFYLISGN